MSQYNAFVPLGRLTITAPGATTLLSANCGPYGGQTGTYPNPPVPGNAWRAMVIEADSANSANLYLLPRGSTVAANPGAIIAKIGPGGSLAFPQGVMLGTGFTPENFCIDMDSGTGSQYAYGYGTLG